MKDKINSLLQEIKNLSPTSKEDVEQLRIKYLSKKGEISLLFNDFKNVAGEEKRIMGQMLNQLKDTAQNKFNEMKEFYENAASKNDEIDLTRTASAIELGTRHPLSIVRNEIIDIFSRIGFIIAEGPEIEDDWHVFGALNFPPEHPARDMQDTFFIVKNPDVLLRTHTSSVQSH